MMTSTSAKKPDTVQYEIFCKIPSTLPGLAPKFELWPSSTITLSKAGDTEDDDDVIDSQDGATP